MPEEILTFAPEDREALLRAVEQLETPGLAARLANAVGQPFERIIAALPDRVSGPLHEAVTGAIRRALEVAVNTLGERPARPPDAVLKAMTGVTGGIGGFFGMAALALELPVTTTIMLRSIAEIARSEGEDLRATEPRLACLEVFALGGKSSADDSTETGYYAVRAVLAKAVSEAAKYIAERGLAEEGAPVLVRFIAVIASRFGLVVSEKMAAGAVPVIGALGGASINVVFMDHFQKVAHGHFTVRRLERRYGTEAVRAEYDRYRRELPRLRRRALP